MDTCKSCGEKLHFFNFSLCSKESILTLRKDQTNCMELDFSSSSDEDNIEDIKSGTVSGTDVQINLNPKKR